MWLTGWHSGGVGPESQRPSYEDLAALVALQAKRIAELEMRIAEFDALADEVVRLRADNAELRRRLGLNSSNSSKPPSSDGLARPERRSGGGSGRRPGKQPRSSGSTLELVEKADHTEVHRPDRCANAACGADLADAPEYARQRRQVFDIPEPRIEVTEHQVVAVVYECGQVTPVRSNIDGCRRSLA